MCNISSNSIIINTKVIKNAFNPVFDILLTEKSFKMFPRHNGFCQNLLL